MNITVDSGITQEEIKSITLEEISRFKSMGKEISSITLKLIDNEIEVTTKERSPIRRIRRITGYLSEVDRFNDAKQAELTQRVAHSAQ